MIKVQVNCDKCRSKALTVAASTDGVYEFIIRKFVQESIVLNKLEPLKEGSKLTQLLSILIFFFSRFIMLYIGVISVSIEGTDRDQVVVIGEGVDAACLTRTLRKKVCYARLDTVEEVKDKPKDEDGKKKEDEEKKDPPPCTWINNPPCYQNQVGMCTVVYDDPCRSPCTIM